MRKIIKNIFQLTKDFIKSAKYSRKKQIFLFVLLIAFLIIVRNIVSNTQVTETGANQIRGVRIETITALSGAGSSLQVTGTVESQSEADIRAEGQGQIISLRKSLGDSVFAGEIIVEIENNFERAQVAQAQASLDSAIAARQESSSLTSIRLGNSKVAFDEEKISARNSVTSALTSAESAIFGKADQFFLNPRTSSPVLNISSFGIDDLDERRAQIEDSLIVWRGMINTISSESDMYMFLADAEERLRFMRGFMRDLSDIVTRQGNSTQIADIISARSSIDTALANVSGANDALRNAETNYRLTQEEESQIVGTGLTTRDASVRQAEAGLLLAQAALEKKIIRAPISGTINNLDVSLGDVVSLGQPVAVVANNNALRVKAYITETEKSSVAPGQVVQVGAYEGVVTAVSPALDPVTRKIEVIIGIKDTNAKLVNGQSTRVVINRENVTEAVDLSAGVRIPISAINIGTRDTVVFSVDENDTLVPHVVNVGPIFGDSILITGDINPLLPIVVDARGLKEGEKVEVVE